MKQFVVTYEHEGKRVNVFKTGKTYRTKQGAQIALNNMNALYDGPFYIDEQDVVSVCPHCKVGITTEMELVVTNKRY